MTAPARAAALHEPAERDDPVNGLLDALETLIRTALDNSGEAALRVRLARLLPAAESGAESAKPPGYEDIDRALALASAASLLDRVSRRCRNDAERGAASSARAVLLDELARLKSAASTRRAAP